MTYGEIEVSRKQLRNCSAEVFTAKRHDGSEIFMLRSYASNVCEIFRNSRGNWEMTIFPRWNYSATTKMHMRKFMEDVMGYYVPIPAIRDILKCCADYGAGTYFAHNLNPALANVTVLFARAQQNVVRYWWYERGVYGEWGF